MFAGRWIVQAWATKRAGPAHDPAQLLDHQPHGQRHGHVVFHLGQERRGGRADQPAARVASRSTTSSWTSGRAARVPMPDIGLLQGSRPRVARAVRYRARRRRLAEPSAPCVAPIAVAIAMAARRGRAIRPWSSRSAAAHGARPVAAVRAVDRRAASAPVSAAARCGDRGSRRTPPSRPAVAAAAASAPPPIRARDLLLAGAGAVHHRRHGPRHPRSLARG